MAARTLPRTTEDQRRINFRITDTIRHLDRARAAVKEQDFFQAYSELEEAQHAAFDAKQEASDVLDRKAAV